MNSFYNFNRNLLHKVGMLCMLLFMSIFTNAQITENFATSVPPSGWTLYTTTPMTTRSATVNGYASASGMGSVKVDFYNVVSDIDSLKTPTLNPTIAGDTLLFDHAHAEYPGYADSIAIYTSSNAGGTWTRLTGLVGSSAATLPSVTLSTVPGGLTGTFIPTASQWATKKYGLPIGTNKIAFILYSTYGNDLYLDNIVVTRNSPMVYDSTSAVQVTDTVFPGMNNVAVINAQVYTHFTANALTATEFYGSTAGLTSTSDVTKAKLYYSGSQGGFNPSTATLLGTVNNPSGKFSFTGFNATLVGGVSNFWIVYDVAPGAAVGDVLDASYDSIKVAGTMRYPIVKAPTGSRYVASYFTYRYCQFSVVNIGSYLIGPTNVTFGTINNTTGDFDRVMNYSNLVNDMIQGDSAAIFVTVGPGNAEQVAIYVDWNNNGQYDMPQEEMYYASQVAAAGTTGNPVTGTSPMGYIKVPCTASPGYHRMRVMSDWYGYTRISPCANVGYGEAEEYTINVKVQPTPVASYTAVDTFYTNGVVTFMNTSTGSGLSYQWDYQNDGTFDATVKNGSFQYATNGTYFCKLKITSVGCNGTLLDSVTKKVVIITPPSSTVANFISDKNVVATTDIVTFYDLSTYGPGKWKWSISPTNVGGNTAYFYQNGTTDSTQNPQVLFAQFGKYTVTLTATNVLGSNTITKTYYINCVRSLNMCASGNSMTTTEDAGFLYDDGGKNGNYTAGHYASNLGQCTLLIKPACASKVSLKFRAFDMSVFQTPGGDYLKVYDGTNNTGTPLHTAIGWPGGIQNLINNVAWLPPTLVANSGAMYIEYWTDGAFQAKGFEAEWSSTPVTGNNPPVATFNVPDTIYTGIANSYVCTASGSGNTYDWDFNNDGIFDASGASVTYSYTTATTTTVKCVVSSCQGTTTVTKNVKVLVPTVPPTPLFHATFTTGTPVDVFSLMDDSKNGPTNWTWTITPSTFSVVNGTLNSQNVDVKFLQIGTYTVKLKVSNAFGADSLTKTTYLKVFYYCLPNVNQMNADIGISNVTFGNINNTTAQGVIGYNDYTTALPSTNMELGGVYQITIKRTTNINPINRKVWIDLNGNGTFTDAGEMLFQDAGSTTLSVTGNITIPTSALLGNTRLRVGVNTANLPNLGCGANFFGEFEDYRINLIPDITKPLITLNGADTVYIEAGYVYNDLGAVATDNVTNPQTYTATYNGFTNGTAIANPGTYSVTYTAVDGTGNQAVSKTRIVIVTPDVTKPIITLNGTDTMVIAVGGTYTEPGATANDYYYGPVSPVTPFGTVNTAVVGSYTITYSATDSHGNNALPKLRIVLVVDTVKPVITVNGANPLLWDVHRKPFVDPGVTVTDNYCTTGLNATATTINVDSLGTYTITYSFKDCNGNVAISKTRTVIVQDTVRPTLTFALGTDTFLIDVKTLTSVPEPGYTVNDNYYSNSQLSVNKTGSVNLNVLGSYPVNYTVTDLSANVSKVYTRVYKVVDRVKPVITMIGSEVQNVYRWKVYNDSGATVTDNYYTNMVPVIGGFVDVNLPGLYYLTFNITDPSGNKADEKKRLVNVKESISGINASAFEKGLNVYPNPNTGAFTLEVKMEDAKDMTIAIFDMMGNKVKDLADQRISSGVYNFDLGSLAAGNYMIKFTTEKETVSKKLTVIKK